MSPEAGIANATSIVSRALTRFEQSTPRGLHDSLRQVLVDEEAGHSASGANFFVTESLRCVAERREYVISVYPVFISDGLRGQTCGELEEQHVHGKRVPFASPRLGA